MYGLGDPVRIVTVKAHPYKVSYIQRFRGEKASNRGKYVRKLLETRMKAVQT